MKFNIIEIDSVDSTNSYAIELERSNVIHEGDVVLANYQKGGKGQGDNSWESEYGSNLTFSLVLKPAFISPSNQFVLTQIVSLAIAEVVSSKLSNIDSAVVKVKWPNDIYVNEKKISGILFQNFISGNKIEKSIVGIGMNINQNEFVSNAKNPVSLIHHIGVESSRDEILDDLLSRINYRYEELKSDFDFQDLKTEYMENLYRAGEWSNFSDKGGSFTGKIIDIDEYGQLEIITKSGIVRVYSFKEVEFVNETMGQ